MMIGLRLSTLPYLVLVVDYRNSHLFLTVCANVCYVSMFTVLCMITALMYLHLCSRMFFVCFV